MRLAILGKPCLIKAPLQTMKCTQITAKASTDQNNLSAFS